MNKRIIAFLLVFLLSSVFLFGCSGKQDAPENQNTLSSTIESEVIKTSSTKKPLRDEYVESESTSSQVKVYKSSDNLMIGCYHFGPRWCDHYGSDVSSIMREFRDVVEAGYFNTYILTLNKYFLEALQIVAESGGTVWIGKGNYHSTGGKTIEQYNEEVKYYLDEATKMGLRDVILGYHWDEPVWNGQLNSDFLAQCEDNYRTFGLRNFPVFATGEFSDDEGNININAAEMGKLQKYATKYLTDVGYDSYGVEVRDGFTHPKEKIQKWQTKISPNITDGKSYYTEYRKMLEEFVGHKTNFWYFPCCYGTKIGSSLDNEGYATEGYCLGHLEFMAEDLMNSPNPGGIMIYTYYTFSDKKGFVHRMDIKNEDGYYKYFPDDEKWEEYCDALRRIKKKFDSIKVNPVKKLDV